MAQTNVNIRMDDGLKREFDSLCQDLGLTMTTAFNVFAKAVVRRQRIPFEIAKDIPSAETVAAIEVTPIIDRHAQRAAFEEFFAAMAEIDNEPLDDEFDKPTRQTD